MMPTRHHLIRVLAISLFGLGLAIAEEPMIDLQKSGFDRLAQVEGFDLESYGRFEVVDCEATFRSRWRSDQNRHRGSSDHVTEENEREILTTISALCTEAFASVASRLEEKFQGPRSMTLRPMIGEIDLAEAGHLASKQGRVLSDHPVVMTLELELHDSDSGALVHLKDRRASRSIGKARPVSSVSNRADIRQILDSWSRILLDFLLSSSN